MIVYGSRARLLTAEAYDVGRCTLAWQVLIAPRTCESESELVAARQRAEWEAQEPERPTLSELLLRRWRAGDWTVAPEDLIKKF